MTDVTMAAPSPRLYNRTPTDDHGNFHYQGDLHRSVFVIFGLRGVPLNVDRKDVVIKRQHLNPA